MKKKNTANSSTILLCPRSAIATCFAVVNILDDWENGKIRLKICTMTRKHDIVSLLVLL